MAYKTLRDNLNTILTELTGSGQPLHQVVNHPTFDFGGYPSAFIAPSGNENDYETTNENMRVYAFKVWLFEEFNDQTLAQAYDSLLTAIDAILNKIDEQESPNSAREMANNLANYETLAAVLAVPGRVASDDVEKLLAVEITVRCKVLVALQSLT